jgi:serine protease Do
MLDPVRAKIRIIGLTSMAFLGGVMLASGMEWTAGSHASSLLQGAPAAREVQPVRELNEAFVAIAESVTPAVVNIQVERAASSRAGGGGQIPEPFRRFFEIPEGEGGRPRLQEGTGSGFLISPDGLIMTNNHVVEGASRIRVVLQDRREFAATVVGGDENTDIAVIRVEGSGFPHVRFGSPDDTRVGEWVLAVGNPLGTLDFTVTAGIVSAKGRPLRVISDNLLSRGVETAGYAIESFIQTDAAINPGNSGGPLVNIRGEVIGVNTAIASATGYSQGYGFAVPIDLARRVGEDLIRYGRVRRPILGVVIGEVEVEDAEYYGLPSVSGVLVQDFGFENSPAERGGLRPGDVIVAVQGQPVTRTNELQRRVAAHSPGDRVTLDIFRRGQREQVQIQLTEAPLPAQTAEAPAAARAPAPPPGLGVEVVTLTAEVAREFNLDRSGGVVISQVAPAGAAARRGIREGFRVVEVDGQRVQSAEEFRRVVSAKRAGQVVSLTVQEPNGRNRIANIRLQ